MIPAIRQRFNQEFTPEKYAAYVRDLADTYPGQLDFRIAETPLFVPKGFTRQMLDACEAILDRVLSEDYRRESDRAIPGSLRVPGDEGQPQILAFDFGVCQNEAGDLEPQLIELQGFPSLLAWQSVLPEIYEKHFWCPPGFSPYLNGYAKEGYRQLVKNVLLAGEPEENVVLLEIFPEKQKTRIDFSATEDLFGIRAVCLTDLMREGKHLFYLRDGKKTPIRRIYNRLIFDDLLQQDAAVQEKGRLLFTGLDVTWVPHPSWFYRISKFSLPFLHHPNVPPTRFLHEASPLPADLENYVVKPLFSFAGQGVIIDVTKEEIENIPDPENWIIQRKVAYAPVVVTPDEPAKAEIRIFYLWEPKASRPVAANNLSRLSKGKMVGVRYNQDKTWVGGSFCLFEQ